MRDSLINTKRTRFQAAYILKSESSNERSGRKGNYDETGLGKYEVVFAKHEKKAFLVIKRL